MLTPWKETYDHLDSIFKGSDIALPKKVRLVKAMVFPVVMYGCESWTVKKAEGRRIDDFELWCWKRLFRVPWTARRSNQSILKEIGPGCTLKEWCWSWNSNTLTTSCEELIHWKRLWCWEELGAGGEGDDRGWNGWMASPNRWTWVWVNPGVGDGQGGLACCDSWGHKEWDTTEQLNWTEPEHEINTKYLLQGKNWHFALKENKSTKWKYKTLCIIRTLF